LQVLIDKVALAICGYSLTGQIEEVCEKPCMLCSGQAEAVIAVIKDEGMLHEQQPVEDIDRTD